MTDNVALRPDVPRAWHPPRPYVQALACIVGFGVLWLMSAVVAESLLGRYLPKERSAKVVPLVVAGSAVLSYVASVRVFESRWPLELRFRRIPELVGGLMLGACACLAVVALLLANQWVTLSIRGESVDLLGGILTVGVAMGVAEELLFRGVLFRHMEQITGTGIALAVTSVAFGLIHLANPGVTGWGVACVAIEGGLLFGLVFVVSRSLWLVMGLHIAWNAVQGPILGSTVSGGPSRIGWLVWETRGPELWTGGAFGLEASLLTVGLVVVLVALLAGSLRIVPRLATRWIKAPWRHSHLTRR